VMVAPGATVIPAAAAAAATAAVVVECPVESVVLPDDELPLEGSSPLDRDLLSVDVDEGFSHSQEIALSTSVP